MVGGLPDPNNRVNTALGYKQTPTGSQNNNLMTNGQIGDMQAAQLISKSRHSDRRDSFPQQQLANQRRPQQLQVDYQGGAIFPSTAGHGRQTSTVQGNHAVNSLNISELYSQYTSAKTGKVGGGTMGGGQLYIP